MTNRITLEVLTLLENTNIYKRKDLLLFQQALVKVLSNYEIKEKPQEEIPSEQLNDYYITKFLAWKDTEGKTPATIRQYKYTLTKVLSSIKKPVTVIVEDDIIMYFFVLKMRTVSNRYISNIRLVLSSFFKWLLNKGVIVSNPITGINNVKAEKTIKKAYTDVDLEKLKSNCKTDRDIAIVEFLYSTGVRISEMCKLNIDDVDFEKKTIKVFGKGSKERIIPMSDICIWYLKEYLNTRKDNDEALFITLRENRRFEVGGVQEMLRKLGASCDISKVHPHRFRRTLATNLLKKGMPLEEVSHILGHEKLDTTMIYCNIDDSIVQNNYNRIM